MTMLIIEFKQDAGGSVNMKIDRMGEKGVNDTTEQEEKWAKLIQKVVHNYIRDNGAQIEKVGI